MKRDKLLIMVIILLILNLFIQPVADMIHKKKSKNNVEIFGDEIKVILTPNKYYIFVDNILNEDSLIIQYPKWAVIKYDSLCKELTGIWDNGNVSRYTFENIYCFSNDNGKVIKLTKDEVKTYIGYVNLVKQR